LPGPGFEENRNDQSNVIGQAIQAGRSAYRRILRGRTLSGSFAAHQFGFDHKEYLMVTIDVRSASRISVADLGSAQPEPTGGPIDFGPGGLGRTQRDFPIRAEHIAILNPKWAVLVWRHPKTSLRLDLSTIMVPYFFERKDGMSEMNWPDGPDPFDYRHHRSEIDVVNT
jgi:hypothetical protein